GKQQHESICAHESLQGQTFDDAATILELTARIVLAPTRRRRVGSIRMNQPHGFYSGIAVLIKTGQPLDPAIFDSSDGFSAGTATPAHTRPGSCIVPFVHSELHSCEGTVDNGLMYVLSRWKPGYSISSGRGPSGGGKARSSSARSSWVSRTSSAARFSRTWSGTPARGIAITLSCRNTQASPTCAGVAWCRSATLRKTAWCSILPCSIGE